MKELEPNDVIKNGKLLFSFPVLHVGWEMDSVAYLYSYKNRKYIISTNHGWKVIWSNKETKAQIKEYRAVLKLTEKALKLCLN